MSTINYDTFLLSLANEVDALTTHFVFDGYTALANLLRAPVGSLLVLYIILIGYAMVRGLIDKPQQELFKFVIRAGLIYMLALNWSFFSSHVKDLLVVGSESIATTLMQAVHKNQLGGSINQGLQSVLNEILQLGSDLFDAGSFRKPTPYFAGFMVFFCGSITLGLAFIEIVIAKLMLAVTLCTAPLFILFTLFEQTKSFFDRWLGVVTGFAFVLIFVSSVVGLCVHLLHWVTAGILGNAALTAAIWVPIFIVAVLCVMGITQAVAIGKSIGGSLCTSGGAAMVGGFIGGSMGAWNATKNSAQHTMQLGRQSFSGAQGFAKKGKSMSASSKALFQHMQKNLRRGG
ncbi:MAG: type IV secretion system protein [Legionella sp.]|nr:type IV secretion system protein [Legionella sp.]